MRRKQESGTFLCVVQVGDEESTRTVSAEVLHQLLRLTKQPALRELDHRFGGEAWCSEVSTEASLQGPTAYFSLTIHVPEGHTTAGMSDLVAGEFRRHWDVACGWLLG